MLHFDFPTGDDGFTCPTSKSSSPSSSVKSADCPMMFVVAQNAVDYSQLRAYSVAGITKFAIDRTPPCQARCRARRG